MAKTMCGDCRYWRVLAHEKPLSFGMCEYFKVNPIPLVPVWTVVPRTHGSISPKQTGCKVHKKGDT